MSNGMKIGIVSFLGIAGLAVLIFGLLTKLYSLSVFVVLAVMLWLAAVLVYVLVRERKPGRSTTRTITDSGCREATTRRLR